GPRHRPRGAQRPSLRQGARPLLAAGAQPRHAAAPRSLPRRRQLGAPAHRERLRPRGLAQRARLWGALRARSLLHDPARAMELRIAGVDVLIAYRLNRSFAWNAAHPPSLPPRPRKLPDVLVRLFDRTVECPVGIAAGPLLTAKWMQAYARLGYGLLTYRTVRTVERPPPPAPHLLFCPPGDPPGGPPTPPPLDPAPPPLALASR